MLWIHWIITEEEECQTCIPGHSKGNFSLFFSWLRSRCWWFVLKVRESKSGATKLDMYGTMYRKMIWLNRQMVMVMITSLKDQSFLKHYKIRRRRIKPAAIATLQQPRRWPWSSDGINHGVHSTIHKSTWSWSANLAENSRQSSPPMLLHKRRSNGDAGVSNEKGKNTWRWRWVEKKYHLHRLLIRAPRCQRERDTSIRRWTWEVEIWRRRIDMTLVEGWKLLKFWCSWLRVGSISRFSVKDASRLHEGCMVDEAQDQ